MRMFFNLVILFLFSGLILHGKGYTIPEGWEVVKEATRGEGVKKMEITKFTHKENGEQLGLYKSSLPIKSSDDILKFLGPIRNTPMFKEFNMSAFKQTAFEKYDALYSTGKKEAVVEGEPDRILEQYVIFTDECFYTIVLKTHEGVPEKRDLKWLQKHIKPSGVPIKLSEPYEEEERNVAFQLIIIIAIITLLTLIGTIFLRPK